MKLEVSDSQSNHSDFSCDSQSSQGSSTNDFTPAVPTSRSLTLTRFPYLVFEDLSAFSDLMINTLAFKDRAVHNAGRLASGAGVSGCTGAGWGRRRRRGASRQAYQPAAGPRASLTPHSAAGRALAPHAPAPRPKPLSGRAIIFTYVLRLRALGVFQTTGRLFLSRARVPCAVTSFDKYGFGRRDGDAARAPCHRSRSVERTPTADVNLAIIAIICIAIVPAEGLERVSNCRAQPTDELSA
ncbi:hypothetical protein RR48_11924 [Papilio machaon]|uniref:Uncharacterized protein n=1 Tax=Papilio machaon TaxID=76193 RepID=A0A194RPX6_PAPMA|nr:hypothetical protein RR48_11924 [Papilio machaon]